MRNDVLPAESNSRNLSVDRRATPRLERVCHLTSVKEPLDDRIFFRECVTLARTGYDVIVVAPGDGDSVVSGVRIRTVRRPRGRFERMTKTAWTVYRAGIREQAETYHFHDPELIPYGILLRLHRKRVFYDVHEDLPADVLSKDWIPRPLRAPIALLTDGMSRIASWVFSRIVPATPAIARRFPPSKTTIIRNYPVLGELTAANTDPLASRPLSIVHHGNLTRIRGLFEMIRAMSHPVVPRDARLVIAGTFDSPVTEQEARATPGWSRVEFLGWRVRAELQEVLHSARVGIVLFHPEPNHVEALPGKLWEYMAAGIPLIASNFPLWREIVEGTGCGRVVDPMNVDAVAELIAYFLNHPEESEAMGRRGHDAVMSRYNWSTQVNDLLTIYERDSLG